MKRSEAIKKLIPYTISPDEVTSFDKFSSGVYEKRAERLLDVIEKELGMLPPMQPIPEFAFTAPNEWESEDGTN